VEVSEYFLIENLRRDGESYLACGNDRPREVQSKSPSASPHKEFKQGFSPRSALTEKNPLTKKKLKRVTKNVLRIRELFLPAQRFPF